MFALFLALVLAAPSGTFRQLGKKGEWSGTHRWVAFNKKIFTLENDGGLHSADYLTTASKKLQSPEFASARFLLASAGKLIVIDAGGSLHKVDPTTGETKQLGKPGAFIELRAACELGGKMYAVDGMGSLLVTDLTSGEPKKVAADFERIAFLTAADDGKLYALITGGALHRIDPTTGAATPVGKGGDWSGIVGATVLKTTLYTLDSAGKLTATNLKDGSSRALGKGAEFGGRAITSGNSKIYCVESNGSLYDVMP